MKNTSCDSNSFVQITTGVHMAGAEGFEPSARGFGDRCSTN